MQNVVGPKFGLGAEIESPTGLSVSICLSAGHLKIYERFL